MSRRHQVGRELNAVELEVHRIGERLDEQRFREPRHAAQEAVSAGEETREDLTTHMVLADDHASDFGIETRDQGGGFIERQRRFGTESRGR